MLTRIFRILVLVFMVGCDLPEQELPSLAGLTSQAAPAPARGKIMDPVQQAACEAKAGNYLGCPVCPPDAVCEQCLECICPGPTQVPAEGCLWNPQAKAPYDTESCIRSVGIFRECPTCPAGAVCKPCHECSCPDGQEPTPGKPCSGDFGG